MEEVVQAARARGYALPEDLVEFHLSRTETMGAFIPSSAVDYNEGRPVEYTAIWETLLQGPASRSLRAGMGTSGQGHPQAPEHELTRTNCESC